MGFHTLPLDIKDIINQRNRARRMFQFSRCLDDRLVYLNLKKKAANLIRKFRSSTWNDFTSSLTPGNKAYWRLIRAFSRPKAAVHPLRDSTNGSVLTYSAMEQANILAVHLHSQFQDNPSFHCPTFNAEINRIITTDAIKNHEDQLEDIDPCSPRELHNLAINLKSKCATGPDKISNLMIKSLPVIGFVVLANLFNSCLKCRYFPVCWKRSIVSPILKPNKDPALPGSYRPISLISNLGKLFELVVNVRLKKFHQSHPFIPDFQHGFRPKISTNHQLTRIQELIIRGFNDGNYTAGIFLDVAQAFDRVWHKGLIVKLCRLNMPNYLKMILTNFMSNRTFQVRVGGTLSRYYSMHAGVPQGSVLSPTLFSLYLHDFPALPDTHIALYADDTTLLCTSSKVDKAIKIGNQSLKILEEYFKKWRISVNSSKSSAVLFRPNRKRESIPTSNLSYNNEDIPWHPSTKYLGVILDDRLNFKEHLSYKITKAIATFFVLKPILQFNSGLSLRAKTTIYKTIIRPSLTYGCPTWAYLTDLKLYKVQICQNKILRWISHARWFQTNRLIHRDLDIPFISDYVTAVSTKFFKSSEKTKNTAFRAAMDYNWRAPAKFVSPRAVLEKGSRPP